MSLASCETIELALIAWLREASQAQKDRHKHPRTLRPYYGYAITKRRLVLNHSPRKAAQ